MINENIISRLTNPISYERGFKYYIQGQVTDFINSDNILTATVIGTDRYHTTIDLSNLEANCDCPAFEGNLFCKHLVAVLLTHLKGEIKSKSLPKVKGEKKESTPAIYNINNLEDILKDYSKEEIIAHLKEFEKFDYSITRYFEKLYALRNSADLAKLNKFIRNRINLFSKPKYLNNFYTKMMELHHFVLSEIKFLPVNKTSTAFLLDISYFINEKLVTIDDSRGILSDLVDLLIEKAVLFLNNASPSELEIYYTYMGKPSELTFNINLLDIILNNVSNKDVLEALEVRLDRTLLRIDPGFAFPREVGLIAYSVYLLKNKPHKFEDNLTEFLDIDDLIKEVYIEYLYKENKYAKVVELAKPLLPNDLLNLLFENSLIALDDKGQLIELYTSKIKDSFSLSIFKKLYKLCEQYKPEMLEGLKSLVLNNKEFNKLTKIDFLLFFDMLDDIPKLLSKFNKWDFEHYRGSLDQTIAKLCIVKPEAAIIITRELIKQELKLIYSSNFYDRLIDYINDLIRLKDSDFLNKLFNTIRVHYKTKKKLLERLNIRPNDDNKNAQLDILEIDLSNSD